MIPIPIIIGAALVIGVSAWGLKKFWKEIKEFLVKTFDFIKERFKRAKKAALSTYLKKKNLSSAFNAGIVFIQKFVEKTPEGEWVETIATNDNLSTDELPPEIQAKLRDAKLGEETDITYETQETLKLEVK